MTEISFYNQNVALERILFPYSLPFKLVQAPSGYGKTQLLRKLKEDYTSDEKTPPWYCGFISVSETDSLEDIVAKLAQELELTDLLNRNPDLSHHERFGSALKIRWDQITQKKTEDQCDRAGIILLIDFENRPSPSGLRALFGEILPEALRNLSEFQEFRTNATNAKRFSAVIAVRPLSMDERNEILKNRHVASPIELAPFEYSVIQIAVRQHLEDRNGDIADQLAAHLLFLTGGHPGCISQVLKFYRENGSSPERIVERHAATIWSGIVSERVNEIYDGMPKDYTWLPDVFERLSVYRIIDKIVLARTIDEYRLTDEVKDAYHLSDILTSTYLMSREGQIIKDDITRRLLVIRLRHEQPEQFPDYCHQAREIYEANIHQEKSSRMDPVLCVREYLFQSLQQHVNTINDTAQREAIRNDFFKIDVPRILKVLVEEQNISSVTDPWMERELIEVFDMDWEFKFTVNYYLRNKEFNDEPYNELREHVSRFFSK